MDHINNPSPKKSPAGDQAQEDQVQPTAADQVQPAAADQVQPAAADQVQPAAEQTGEQAAPHPTQKIWDSMNNITSYVKTLAETQDGITAELNLIFQELRKFGNADE